MRLDDASHLFDPLDPLPLPARDLSPTVEQFIVDWAGELPTSKPLRITLHVDPATIDAQPEQLEQAVKMHFFGRASRIERDRNQLLRIGQASMAIGLTVLAVCFARRQLLRASISQPFADYFGEVLIILGSVANWRPLEIFLYDWWPLDRKRRLFQKLASANVDVIPDGGPRLRLVKPIKPTPEKAS